MGNAHSCKKRSIIMIRSECVKMAVKSFLKNDEKVVNAFTRKADPLIGEELVHKLSGRRFFKAPELHNSAVSVKSCPVEITEDGYRGISNEYFEALKDMKIRLKEVQYGGQEVYDDFTTRFYWGRKCTDGTTLALSDAMVGGGGKEKCKLFLIIVRNICFRPV